MRLRVALFQIAISDEEPLTDRLRRGVALLDKEEVHLALFPELWVSGFFNDDYAEVAESISGPIATTLAEAAARQRVWLHAGSIVERAPGGQLHNTSLVFDPDGQLSAVYRKIHLFGHNSRERALLTPGREVVTFSAHGVRFALSTCYDLRFPEVYRLALAQGAEVFLVSSAWPEPRREHWRVLLQARAIENLAYIVACNAAGKNRGHAYLGESTVAGPWGELLARADAEETVLVAEIDLTELARVRSSFPALEDRWMTGRMPWTTV